MLSRPKPQRAAPRAKGTTQGGTTMTTRNAGRPIDKPAAEAGLQGAIAEALGESKYEPEGDLEGDLSSFDEELSSDDDGSGEDRPSRVESPQASVPAEGEAPFTEEELATAEQTESYWGTDLTGIPVERKAALIRHLSQQDSTIRQLQARLSTPKQQDAPPAVEAEEVTDEALLTVLGLDPESLDERTTPVLLAMARNQLSLEDKVAKLETMETGRAVESHWNRELDELEATYGKLPGERLEVLRYAAEEDIATPADLYFRLTAPVKREVESLAAAARKEAAKRAQSGGLKPRSSSAEPVPVKPGMSMRDAVKAAAMAAQKETGLSWKQAVRRVVTKTPGAQE
jgi:hypothetical protein